MLPCSRRSLPTLLALAVVTTLAACSGGGGGQSGPGGPGDPPPECTAGATRGCYSGPAGTDGVGACKPGVQTCTAGGTWAAGCSGEVLPAVEACANGVDDDCNGAADDSLDQDGDGWTACDGDCCDVAGAGCPAPLAVNPAAYDFPGDGLDQDCSGAADDGGATCDAGLAGAHDPADLAHALDLCRTASGPRDWGIVNAAVLRANGLGLPVGTQYAVRASFGGHLPQAGEALAILSTGATATPAEPGYVAFQDGLDNLTTSDFPQDWLAANGGALPNAPGCPSPTGAQASDPVMLQLTLRVPSNAQAFRLRASFVSAEFPEWTCSAFNDFFVALLDSADAGSPANPADKNLAVFTTAGGAAFPVGVNLATGSTGLFTQCTNGAIGCASGAVAGSIATCIGTGLLTGTGLDVAANSCQAGDLAGGGTGWLTVQGNVLPGETMRLRLALWDTGDGKFDSAVLLDGFEWLPERVAPGATP